MEVLEGNCGGVRRKGENLGRDGGEGWWVCGYGYGMAEVVVVVVLGGRSSR